MITSAVLFFILLSQQKIGIDSFTTNTNTPYSFRSKNVFTYKMPSPSSHSNTRTNMIIDDTVVTSLIHHSSVLSSNIIAATTDLVDTSIPAATDAVTSIPAATDAVTSDSSSFIPSYSKASYYTTLALYALTFPGIWSQIKRSTAAKVKQKNFLSLGEAVEGGKDLRQQAGEIMAYMKANNYEVTEAGEVIKFRGLVQKSSSQGIFLVFCTTLALASLALVLQIQLQDLVIPFIGKPNWYYIVLLSPYAGFYYFRSGDRVDEMKVKLGCNDDETENEITIEGNDDEIERMWRTLGFVEKGMVRIEGLME